MSEKRAPGRPTSLTPRVQQVICKAIRESTPMDVAVRAAGISKTAFYRWLERAEEGGRSSKPFVEFRDAIRAALAEREKRLAGLLDKAAKKDWRAALALLQWHPASRDRWGRNADGEKHERN